MRFAELALYTELIRDLQDSYETFVISQGRKRNFRVPGQPSIVENNGGAPQFSCDPW